mgnify:CR=1 FL=1
MMKIAQEKYFNFSNSQYLMIMTNSFMNIDIDIFLKKMNLDKDYLCKINQTHSDKIIFAKSPKDYGEADGLITNTKNENILLIQTADCIPMFIYNTEMFGLIHAGWRGIVQKIHCNAIKEFINKGSELNKIKVFLGPSIKPCCFEIQSDIVENFNLKYIINKNNKMFVDLTQILIDDLINFGILRNNISYSNLCTYDSLNCVSYRRDNNSFKRMYSIMCPKKCII